MTLWRMYLKFFYHFSMKFCERSIKKFLCAKQFFDLVLVVVFWIPGKVKIRATLKIIFFKWYLFFCVMMKVLIFICNKKRKNSLFAVWKSRKNAFLSMKTKFFMIMLIPCHIYSVIFFYHLLQCINITFNLCLNQI